MSNSYIPPIVSAKYADVMSDAARTQPSSLLTIDLFPLSAPDTGFERLGAVFTVFQDALTTLEALAITTPGSHPKQVILLVDSTKKGTESDAKAHKWEVEELRTTIAALRDELSKLVPCVRENDGGANVP